MNLRRTAPRISFPTSLALRSCVAFAGLVCFLSVDSRMAVGQDDPEAAAMAKIEAVGGTVRKIAMSVESKEAAFHLSDKPVTDEALAALPEIKELVWLYLQGTAVTDDGLKHVGKVTELTKLHLEKTSITDAGVAHLVTNTKLEYLNLYGTKVTDGCIDSLAKIASLKRVYLWQTGVTDEGAARLRAALPDAQVVLAAKLAEPRPEPAADMPDEPAKESLAKGKFIRIRLVGDARILSLSEVQVQQTGDNMVLQTAGKATQSSVDFGGDPARANDGNASQNYNDGSTSHTATEKDPWWQLDLNGVKEIGRIKVLNRGDCCGDRLADAVVEVLDEAQNVVWSDTIKDVKDGSVHVFVKK